MPDPTIFARRAQKSWKAIFWIRLLCSGPCRMPRPWGEDDAVIPLVSAEDVSRVAVALLAQPGPPSQNVYALVGETPTVNEIVSTLGSVLGAPIRYIQITDQQWADAVKDRINAYALDHLSHLWQYFRKGEDKFQ